MFFICSFLPEKYIIEIKNLLFKCPCPNLPSSSLQLPIAYTQNIRKIKQLKHSAGGRGDIYIARNFGRQGAKKVELHTPSVDWSTESSLPCDRQVKHQKVPARYFWTTAKASFIEDHSFLNVTLKFADLLGCSSLLLFV